MSADIERQSLDAHVSLCELRYQALERRLGEVENKLESLQTLVLEIRDSLSQLPARHDQRHYQSWHQFQWWLIGALAAGLGAAAHRFLG